MTRINCVPVEELHYKHLVVEYRELPRVFAPAKAKLGLPKKYTMGTGHVLFFYDKLEYLYKRQVQLVLEMQRRGYKPTYDPESLREEWQHKKPHLWNDWKPDVEALAVNRQRLADKLRSMK